MKKHFVLDTNVLLHNADAISSFADNVVVLPMTVIEELDKFKSRNDELARNARQIDNPYLDSRSNGLAYKVERLKAQQVHGHVTLMKSERSILAGIAAEYL
jgi:predicted ribonuclease YlaK